MVQGVGSGGTFGAGKTVFCLLKSEKLRPGVGAPTEDQRALLWVDLLQRATSVPLLFLWEARPRGEGELSARSRAKASPRGGPPTEGQKPCSGVDLLQQATSVPPFLAGGATSRRRRAFYPLKSKASPRGRGSHRRSKALLWGGSATAGGIRAAFVFVGGATSRRRRAFCPLKSKASPRGRGSHRRSKALLVGGSSTAGNIRAAFFFVGGAPPRRRRAFCPLKSKSFAPRSGLLQKSPATRSPMRILR